MEMVWDLSWRIYIVMPMLTFGVGLVVAGIRRELRGFRMPLTERGKNLTTMRGLRLVVFGLAVIGTAVSWLWQIPAILAAALVIGFEEMLETSIIIYALRREAALEG